jgi:RNA polymerase primary sigma factor
MSTLKARLGRNRQRLKDKVNQAEEQNEFVKDLVRGLDDDSTEKEIEETKKRIFQVCADVEELEAEIVNEDGTLRKLTKKKVRSWVKLKKSLLTLLLTERSLTASPILLKVIPYNFVSFMSNKTVSSSSLEVESDAQVQRALRQSNGR